MSFIKSDTSINFIISKKYEFGECIYNQKINGCYTRNGLSGIFKLFQDCQLKICEKKTKKNMVFIIGSPDIRWEIEEEKITDIILRTLKERRLHRNLVKFIRKKINKTRENFNTKDLCFNSFYDASGTIAIPHLKIFINNGVFNFSKADIQNIYCNALENNENVRAIPKIPKNPYNGKPFNIYELKLMFDFLEKENKSKIEKCYNNTTYSDSIPETIRLFRYCQFDINKLIQNYSTHLNCRACKNYVKNLSDEQLALEIFIAFGLFKIDDKPNTLYIKKYLTYYRQSIENIISSFTYYYHYLELEDLLTDILYNTGTTGARNYNNMIILIEKFKCLKREIFIVGHNTRKIINRSKNNQNKQNNLFIFRGTDGVKNKKESKTILNNKHNRKGKKNNKNSHFKNEQISTFEFYVPKYDPNTFKIINDDDNDDDNDNDNDNDNLQISLFNDDLGFENTIDLDLDLRFIFSDEEIYNNEADGEIVTRCD